MIDAVLLNGTVGAGKSTTAVALSRRLSGAGTVHAVVDVDQVRLLWPPPPGDPFQQAVALANVRDLARNYRDAGAVRLILAGVVERAEDLADLRAALAGWSLLACRLTIAPDDAAARLRARHHGDAEGLAWHLDRSPLLADDIAHADIDDAVVDTGGRTEDAVAELVAEAAGW